MTKIYTLDEARKALPLVRSIVRDIRAIWKEIALDPTRDDIFSGKRSPEQCTEAEIDRLRGYEMKLSGFIAELEELSISIKSPEVGLVDFPALKDGEPICLCWRDGEADIRYWHTEEAGFLGRQLIIQEHEADSQITFYQASQQDLNLHIESDEAENT